MEGINQEHNYNRHISRFALGFRFAIGWARQREATLVLGLRLLSGLFIFIMIFIDLLVRALPRYRFRWRDTGNVDVPVPVLITFTFLLLVFVFIPIRLFSTITISIVSPCELWCEYARLLEGDAWGSWKYQKKSQNEWFSVEWRHTPRFCS